MLNTSQRAPTNKLLVEEPSFLVFVELFKRMNKEKDREKLEVIGGVRELAKTIGVDIDVGIDTTPQGQERFSLEHRAEAFGKNEVEAFKPKRSPIWTQALVKKLFLVPLLIAAMVTTILVSLFREEREDLGWIHSIGIWALVLIIVFTSITLDYQLSLNRDEMHREKHIFNVTVFRDSQEKHIRSTDLLVGDILVLTKDVHIAADGLLFVANDLFIDEENVTGDKKPVKKDFLEDPFCRSGTVVTDGYGRMLVIAVGASSVLDETMRTVSSPTRSKNTWIKDIKRFFFAFNVVAVCLGVISFIILLIRWIVRKKGFPLDQISDEGPIHFLMLAIVIIVVELPDGFFLFLLCGYIYLAWKSAKDNIILHRPDVFVLMKDVSTICFRKAGTITENMMTIVNGWFQETYYDYMPNLYKLDAPTKELIIENVSLNSKATLGTEEDGSIKFVGNQSECALLVMLKEIDVDYRKVRSQKSRYIIKNYEFNSATKMSSVIVRHGDLLRLYSKGAAEIVLRKCTECVDSEGLRNPINTVDTEELENTIDRMHREGLSSLALTYADLDPNEFNFSENGEPLDESSEGKKGFAEAPEENLVLLGVVGIEDPIRMDVLEVVEQFKKAGIVVRMITSDNLDTAKHTAGECGILTDGRAMSGAEFRRRADEDIEGLKKDLPHLQVLARSSPSDKQTLVKLLKSINETVAVPGNGTNDVHAMRESHLAIAMGTRSTKVAIEAADMVIRNDNISSILKFYLQSRCLWLNIWGYAQFRLSVTLVVWIVVLVSVCVGGETPLNVHQFLATKFITDTMVVITFATESPPSRVPDDGSYQASKESKGWISFAVHILFQSLYQIIILICTFYSLSSLFERYEVPAKDKFYYHYCYEDLTGSTTYRHGPIWLLCDQYLDCSHFTKNCTLLEEQELDDLYLDYDFRDHIIDGYEGERDAVEMRKSSLMFNLFIFMQFFNALNCRKSFDEYNIFHGLFNSPLSCAIRLLTIGLQLMIMLTPVRSLFEVTELNAWEWLYSMAISAMVIPLGTFVRYRARKARRRR